MPVDYRIVQTDTGAVLTCVDRNSGEVRVFEWKAELVFEERRQMGEEEPWPNWESSSRKEKNVSSSAGKNTKER